MTINYPWLVEQAFEVGEWLQRNSGAVSLLFAAAVAGFTWSLATVTKRLWLVTKQSADAATRSADAAVRIELPIVPAHPPDLYSTNDEVSDEGSHSGVGVSQATPVNTGHERSYVPQFKFRNDGRTPAFPRELRIGHCIAANLEGEPIYAKTIVVPIARIIAEHGEARIDINYPMEFSPDELHALSSQQAKLWLFCQLTYADFMDETHEPRWCWVWECPTWAGPYYFSDRVPVPATYRRK